MEYKVNKWKVTVGIAYPNGEWKFYNRNIYSEEYHHAAECGRLEILKYLDRKGLKYVHSWVDNVQKLDEFNDVP